MSIRRKQIVEQTHSNDSMEFVPNNSVDFFPDGVEDDSIIEAKYQNVSEKTWKKIENKVLKMLLE